MQAFALTHYEPKALAQTRRVFFGLDIVDVVTIAHVAMMNGNDNHIQAN